MHVERERPFRCGAPGALSGRRTWVADERTHSAERLFQVRPVPHGASSSSTRHEAPAHAGAAEEPFKCGLCEKGFGQPSHLLYHQHAATPDPFARPAARRASPVGEAAAAQVPAGCGRAAPSSAQCATRPAKRASALQKHQLGPLRPRPRSPCAAPCASAALLLVLEFVQHRCDPARARSRRCPDCDKRPSTLRDLQRHRRVHTGEKPYKCPNCDKAFKQREHLNKHQGVHARASSSSSARGAASASWTWPCCRSTARSTAPPAAAAEGAHQVAAACPESPLLPLQGLRPGLPGAHPRTWPWV